MKKTFYRRFLLAMGLALGTSWVLYPLLLPSESYFRMLLQLLPMVLLSALVLLWPLNLLSTRLSRGIAMELKKLRLDSRAALSQYPELRPLARQVTSLKAQIATQMNELTGQQEQLQILTDNMQEGLLLISASGRVLSYNKAAIALLHCDSPEEDFFPVFTLNDTAPFREVVSHALAGVRGSSVLNVEGNAVQFMANPVTRDGSITGAVLMLLDVTEREKRDNLRREFTANVSHELKTPLTSIYGIADMMSSGMVKEADISGFAARIRDESSRMIALVEDIIRLSRLDDESFSEEVLPLDLYEIAECVRTQLAPSAERQNITMRLEGTNAMMQGVPVIVEEMLYNLCDNAIKYNVEGGEVYMKVTGSEKTAVFSVTDTGIGIPQADRERIFERFYRVDKSHSRQIGGTGLGLSIVKHGAAFHNARIEVDSQLGAGTTITLYFPRDTESAVTLESASRGNPLNVEIPGTEQHGLITVLDDAEPEMIPGTVVEDPVLPPEDVQKLAPEPDETAGALNAEPEAAFAESMGYNTGGNMPDSDTGDDTDDTDDTPKPPPPPRGGKGRKNQPHKRPRTGGKPRRRIPLAPIDKDTMDIPI